MEKKILELLNKQINAEINSAYLYLSMAAYLRGENLNGSAKWMEVQYQEELSHAKRIYDFVYERGENVVLDAIEAPKTSWDSVLALFEDAYDHEKKVTGMINALVDLSIEIKDHATFSFLQWFVDEQVEEESSVDDIVQKLKMIKDSSNGLLMLDAQLGKRV